MKRSSVGFAVLAQVAVALAGCGGMGAQTENQKKAAAHALIRKQVAPDIKLQLSLDDSIVSDAGGPTYHVCGTAKLDRPGDGPLALHNVTQRFVTTVNRESGAGVTRFDGSSSTIGKAEFQGEWDRSCGPTVS